MKLITVLREHTKEILVDFIASKVTEYHADGIVLGLSGGVDSAVVAKLSADALGPKNVLTLILPATEKQKEDISLAIEYADLLHVQYKVIDISSIVEIFKKSLKENVNKMVTGNITARIRMTIFYYHANVLNRLVMGTSNKSELLMGYFTKFGDGGADYLPLGDLYKTQVRDLARILKVPVKIIKKPPSAGFWKGQTDETEMGIKYDVLDKILYGIELGLSEDEIHERTGISMNEIIRIQKRVKQTIHKRKMPLIPKLGVRTLGADWRE